MIPVALVPEAGRRLPLQAGRADTRLRFASAVVVLGLAGAAAHADAAEPAADGGMVAWAPLAAASQRGPVPPDLIFRDAFEMPVHPVVYRLDDGSGNVNIGPPSSFDPDMLWGNYYPVQAGGEVITQISVAFGATFPSLANGPVTFWLLQDADGDFDPRNAQSLASVQATPDVFNDQFFTVAIPPTQVSGALFVGVSARLLGGQDRPGRVDTGAAGDRSWFFYAPDIAAVIDDLAAAPFGTRMDDPQYVPFPGAFMVRATGVPAD